MSEYQYYEFQAIDRRLTEAEMQQLRMYSTRAQITATSFVNEYNWGDFKGDVDAWMERYFDGFLYFANWGTRILKLRLPARVLDPDLVRAYSGGDSSSFRQKGDHLILTFESELESDDDTYDLEGCGLLSSLIPLRGELARGDRRALYVTWLGAVQCGGFDDDTIEPPVPAGLGELSGSLAALADFLRIDPDLIEVAARVSAPSATLQLKRGDVLAWVGSLAPAEKDEILTRLVVATDESASISAELLRRFCQARDASQPEPSRSPEPRRSVGELLRATEQRASQRMQAAARKAADEKDRHEREAAAARARLLDGLAGKEPRLWAEAERLAATKLPKNYDQAVVHLINLRDLAAREGRGGSANFATRLERFRASHVRKPSLLARLDRAGS